MVGAQLAFQRARWGRTAGEVDLSRSRALTDPMVVRSNPLALQAGHASMIR
jgi:hypothetical protein